MKIKAFFITAVLVAAAGAGASYFVRKSNADSVKVVEVVPILSINSASYGMTDGATISGTIVSKDTQVVTLDNTHEVKNVYVKTGDKVKKGEKLLEYDMLGDELKAEKEELTKLGLELSLDAMKKDLATLRSGKMPDYEEDSGSDDNSDDSNEESGEVVNEQQAEAEPEGDGTVGAADTIAESSVKTGAMNQSVKSTQSGSADHASASQSGGKTGTGSSEADEIVSDGEGTTLSSGEGTNSDEVVENTDGDEEQSSGNSEDAIGGSPFSLISTGSGNSQDSGELEPDALFEADETETETELEPSEIDNLIDSSGQNNVKTPDAISEESAIADANEGAITSDLADQSKQESPAIFSTAEDGSADPSLIADPEADTQETAAPETAAPETAASEAVVVDNVEEAVIPDESSTSDVTVPDAIDTTLETNFEGDIAVEDDTDEVVSSIIPVVNEFLQTVNTITLAVNGGWDAIGSQMGAINSAMEQFRSSFAESHEFQTVDLFGETVNQTAYTVRGDVIDDIGNATAEVVQTAYDRLCAYHFINTMLNLNPGKVNYEALDSTWAATNEAAIREACSELASLPDSLWIYNSATGQYEFSSMYAAMNEGVFSGQTMVQFLAGVAQALNGTSVMEEPTDEEPQISTEGKLLNEEKKTNAADGGSDSGYSAEDIAKAIEEQEKSIKETELQIREAELGIKEYQKILDGRIVYAKMDGIVKNAGTATDSVSGAFITITGKAGLYVQGTVSELELDTVKVGDIITGTSYTTGGSFSAQIVEISEYPTQQGGGYYSGDGNSNTSYYPFLAYIEQADGLTVDSYVDLSLSGAGTSSDDGSTGLALEEYYIRKDENGRNYCLVKGEDGLIEKRYVEVGANNWGLITIKSGLTQSDMIAFPYGDGVEEGAKTKEVDSLSAVDGESY